MSVTLTQIAEHCGRSLSTVSNVLRAGERAQRYSDRTRREVLDAATRLGYRPNFFASQLQKQNRRLVMLTYGALSDTFASRIANAFGQTVTGRGYGMLAAPLDQSCEKGLLDSVVGPQGILALAVIGDASADCLPDDALAAMAARGTRIVSIGRRVGCAGVCQVLYDNDAGVRAAASHLVDQGARRIWLVGGQPDGGRRGLVAGRLDTARAVLAARGVDAIFEPALPVDTWPPQDTFVGMGEALAHEPAPDGVFCVSDLYAIGALRALRQAGLVPGRDVAVVGFNDGGQNDFLEPPLSSVHIPVDALGRLAANQLLDFYEGLADTATIVTLETRLVVRESSHLNASPCEGGRTCARSADVLR